MASLSTAVAPMALETAKDLETQQFDVKKDDVEENGVFIECYTAPDASHEDNEAENDVSVYYEEELVDDDDDDNLTTNDHEHDLDSYEEVTIGEDDELLDEEEVSDDEEIVELSEAAGEEDAAAAAQEDRDGVLDDATGDVDDSSVAMVSTDSKRGEHSGDTLHNQMQSAITEGARKAMMEQIEREKMLKEVAERRQKQRQLLQQETERLKAGAHDGKNKAVQKNGAARNTLLKEIQRINDAVSKNAATQASAAKCIHKPTNLDKKTKALAELRRQTAREELAKTNDTILKASKAKAETIFHNSPRSVSEHHEGSSARDNSSLNYKIGLAKLSSLDAIVTPKTTEEEDSCIESNADYSQKDFESKQQDNTTIETPVVSKSHQSREPKKSTTVAKSYSLACVLPGNYSTVSKTVSEEFASIEDTLDDSTIVKSVDTSAVKPSTPDKSSVKNIDNTEAVGSDALSSSMQSKDGCNQESAVKTNPPVEKGGCGIKTASDARPPTDSIDGSIHSLASQTAKPFVMETNESLSVPMTPHVVTKNRAKSLIETFASPKETSTSSHPGNQSTIKPIPGQLPIPSVFVASPTKDSMDKVSTVIPTKRSTFSPRKMTAQVPSAFRTCQKENPVKDLALSVLLPFESDDTGDYHSLEDLQSGKAQDTDITRREQYLSPREFQRHFKMSKEEFQKLPKWKRDKTKRALKLF